MKLERIRHVLKVRQNSMIRVRTGSPTMAGSIQKGRTVITIMGLIQTENTFDRKEVFSKNYQIFLDNLTTIIY